MYTDDGISSQRASNAAANQSTSWFHYLRAALYEVHFRHSEPLIPPRHQSLFRRAPQLLIVLAQCVQLIGIVLECGESVSGYQDFGYLYTAINVFRPEQWLSNYTQTSSLLWLSLSFLFVSLSSFLLELFLAHLDYESDFLPLLSRISQNSSLLIHRILLLPMTSVWFTVLSSDTNTWEQGLAAAGLSLMPGLLVVRVLFVTNNNWHIRNFCLFAKTGAGFEVREIGGMMIIAAFNSEIAGKSAILACFGVMCVGIFLLWQLLTKIPYFTSIAMYTKVIEYTLVCWMSLCVVLGIACESIRVTLGLFAFISPCFGLFSVCYFQRILRNWPKSNETINFTQFEVSLRLLLAQFYKGEITDSTLREIIKASVSRFEAEKGPHLLFAQYYFYIRNESEYALLRLSCAHACPSDFLVDFQVQDFFAKVSESFKSEERVYLDYIQYYREATQTDMFLSKSVCSVLTQLLSPIRNSKPLELAFSDLAKRVKAVKSAYYAVRKRFPNDLLTKHQFLSLEAELFYDGNSEDALLNVSRKRDDFGQSGNLDSYSGIDIGVFVISCHTAQLGKIVFANQKSAEILDTTTEDIEGTDLDDYLPPPFAINHNALLRNFMRAGEVKEIFRSHLFLYAHGKYSVEVTFRFRPTAFRCVPYFVVGIKAKSTNRTFALFDSDFNITSHSKSLLDFFGLKTEKGTLNGLNLRKLMPDIEELHAMGDNRPLTHKCGDEIFYVLFSSTGLGSMTVRWVYFFTKNSSIKNFIDSAEHIHTQFLSLTISTVLHQDSLTPKFKESDHISESIQVSSSPLQRKDEGSCMSSQISNFAVSLTGFNIRRRILTAEKRYKYAFVIGACFASILAGINMVVLFNTLQTLADARGNSQSSLCLAPMHMMNTVYFVRSLSLLNSGMEDQSLASDFSNQLKSEILSLEMVAQTLLQSGGVAVSVWEQRDKRHVFKETNVASALSDFITHASAFLASSSYADSDDFYYVYRNGVGELLSVINATVNNQIQEQVNEGSTRVITISIATVLTSVAVFSISILFILRSIQVLDQCYLRLWKLLLGLAPWQLQTLALPHQERLSVVHGMTISPLKKQPSGNAENALLQPTRRWPKLLFTFFIYILVSGSMFALVGFYGYSQLNTIVNAGLDTIGKTGWTLTLPRTSLFFLKEAMLDSESKDGYFHEITVGQEVTEIQDLIRGKMKLLNILMNAVNLKLVNAKYTSLLDFLLSNACPTLPAFTTCPTSPMAKGLHSAQHEYFMAVSSILESLDSAEMVSNLLIINTDAQATALTAGFLLAYDNLTSFTDGEVDTFRTDMVLYFSMFCLSSFVLYFSFYRREIIHMRKDCMNLWQVSMLVRSDFLLGRKKKNSDLK